ncbi:aconitase X swivel domain-containing protein [Streptomyces halstedii]|uniref:aconitase X swivel domain-containing protein n=1 Tax=Streptomyces halstedii TaxID=1944 RepID=UPI003664B04E
MTDPKSGSTAGPAADVRGGTWAVDGVCPGSATGEALVCTEPISGWGGIDPATGTIVETRHPQRGATFAGKILVIPGAKGSSGWSGQFHLAMLNGTAPAAIVFDRLNSKLALGLVVLRTPAVTSGQIALTGVIRTGDQVGVDADNGLLTVTPPRPETALPQQEGMT